MSGKRKERRREQPALEARDRGQYEKRGYLYDDFRMFHLRDTVERSFQFHYHDFYKILILLGGSVTYNVEGKAYPLRPYDIVLVGRGEIHRPEVSFGEPYERVIFYISEEYLERHRGSDYDLAECFARAGKEGCSVLRFQALVNTGLMDIVSRIERNGDRGEYAASLYARVLFTEFMILLNRACRDTAECFSRNVSYNQKMIHLLQYINTHLGEELTIEDLAEHFYVSKYHMMRQFKEETGYTIHQYITEKRVLEARKLLAAGMSATKVCFACGFRDYSTFSRAFKARMDRLPSQVPREEGL